MIESNAFRTNHHHLCQQLAVVVDVAVEVVVAVVFIAHAQHVRHIYIQTIDRHESAQLTHYCYRSQADRLQAEQALL
jgi:hypothetical protein